MWECTALLAKAPRFGHILIVIVRIGFTFVHPFRKGIEINLTVTFAKAILNYEKYDA